MEIFVFFIIVSIPFAYAAYTRNLRHKETMALIEKGLLEAPQFGKRKNGKDALRWGIIISSIGFAILIGVWPMGSFIAPNADIPLGFGPWMLFGLIPTFFGLGLIAVYKATADESEEKEKTESKDSKKK